MSEEELNNNQENTNYDTLVLAGGAMKSFIIFGAIQYTLDNFFLNNIETYIGTSGGTIINFLLIIGYTPIEVMIYTCTHQKLQNFNMFAMMNGLGAISFSHIYELLEKMTIDKLGYIPTFKDIKEKFNKDFICVTYNITENITEYISHDNYPSLPCLIGIRMSSNLPLIFENFKYGQSYYVDGGLTNNFPLDIGMKKGKKILDIYNKAKEFSFTKNSEFNILEYIYKIIFIPITEINKQKLQNIEINQNIDIINIEEHELNMFNFNISTCEKLQLFSKGYQVAKQYFEK